MRAMPNMHVYSPCDAYELRAMMRQMITSDQPAYMQLVRPKLPKIFDDNITFVPGKAVLIREGNDVTLVSTGFMTKFAVDVADELAGQGVGVDLLHCPSVKPMDEAALIASAKKTGAVVTVENQNIVGGLGSAVSEILGENHPVPIQRLGINDQFGEVATQGYLFDKHCFGPEHITEACKAILKRKA